MHFGKEKWLSSLTLEEEGGILDQTYWLVGVWVADKSSAKQNLDGARDNLYNVLSVP